MNAARYPAAFRARYLPAMTRSQIEAIPGKASAVVIIPTGSIEQHGLHLPVGVDAMLGQAWLASALPHLPSTVPVYVGPAITYGKSNEHSGFPGTVSISSRTLHRILKSIARQLCALGFHTMAVFNSHGGNTAVLVSTLREIQTSLGINAGLLSSGWRPARSPQEAAYGFHAGQFETALMLAVAPELVDMRLATKEYPANTDEADRLQPVGGAATYGWIAADLSASGAVGDATAATAADGHAWLDAGGRALAAQIVRLTEQVRTAR